MTDDDITKMYEQMCDYFGSSMPNFEQEPKRFAAYVKMYKFIKKINEPPSNPDVTDCF